MLVILHPFDSDLDAIELKDGTRFTRVEIEAFDSLVHSEKDWLLWTKEDKARHDELCEMQERLLKLLD